MPVRVWFVALLLIVVSKQTFAQCLSIKDVIAISEIALGKQEKFLNSKGFVGQHWRREDPDIAGDAGACKFYSKATGSYLVFHPDSHGNILRDVRYRFRNPICFAQLQKQALLAGFKVNEDTVEQYTNNHTLRISNKDYQITLIDEPDTDKPTIHHCSLVLYRAAAYEEWQKLEEQAREEFLNTTRHQATGANNQTAPIHESKKTLR